jgi:hypothetical protein
VIYDTVRDANGNYSDIWSHSKELIVGGTYKFDKLKMFAGWEVRQRRSRCVLRTARTILDRRTTT